MSRTQEFAFLACSFVQVTISQGWTRLPRVLDPIKISPFVVPTTIRKQAPTGNAPMGASPPKAGTNRFPQVGGNQTIEASEVVFDPIQGDEGVETLPPMTS